MTDLAPDPNGAHLQQLCEQMHRESLSERRTEPAQSAAVDLGHALPVPLRSESGSRLSGAAVQPERVASPHGNDGNEQVHSDSGPAAALSYEWPEDTHRGTRYEG